jgi:hypothetical protein
LTDNAWISTGVDDIIESFFADRIKRPDISTKDFTVAQATPCMFIVNAEYLANLMSIAPSYDFCPILLHIPKY